MEPHECRTSNPHNTTELVCVEIYIHFQHFAGATCNFCEYCFCCITTKRDYKQIDLVDIRDVFVGKDNALDG